MDVTGAKGPYTPADIGEWARRQLLMAETLVADPGGGLLFATQAIGQVRSVLQEHRGEEAADILELLGRAEDLAVHRDYDAARGLLREAADRLR